MTSATEQTNALTSIGFLIAVMRAGKFDYVDETVCQSQIQQHFDHHGVSYLREYDLGDFGKIDFYLPNSRLGLEVKASKLWSRTKVFRQCERYCRSGEIDGLLLATARSQSLPADIEGVPTKVFYLGECQL